MSLSDLFEQAFGYRTTAFNAIPIRTEAGVHGAPYYATDAHGKEYFLPVTLTSPGRTIELPYPVISITSRKTIIETPLTERRGTVKELINIQDYEINIKGFIISDTNDFPETAITLLRDLYEQNTAVSITNPITDIFLLRTDRKGSDQVVIKEIRLPPITGIKNIRPYELVLVSDEPFNLIDISSR